MRLWSIHPSYLDAKGLVALWREGLLARKVLMGQTKGYTNHPQLTRFKASKNPLDAINYYLEVVVHEADTRGYQFDSSKIILGIKPFHIPVTVGQLIHEISHLRNKLEKRDPDRIVKLSEKPVKQHPLFKIIPGEIEEWEKVSDLIE